MKNFWIVKYGKPVCSCDSRLQALCRTCISNLPGPADVPDKQDQAYLYDWTVNVEPLVSGQVIQLMIQQWKPDLFAYLCCNPWSKQPTSTTRADSPCINLFWVTPHEITERAFVRNFAVAVNNSDLCIKKTKEKTLREGVKDMALNLSFFWVFGMKSNSTLL